MDPIQNEDLGPERYVRKYRSVYFFLILFCFEQCFSGGLGSGYLTLKPHDIIASVKTNQCWIGSQDLSLGH